MKTICIYHSRDLDGWMSAAIVKKWFVESNKGNYTEINITNQSSEMYGKTSIATENRIDFLRWDYGNDIPDLSEYDKVIMCDVSFPREVMIKLLNQLDNKLIWIDHHFGAIRDIVGIHEINKVGEDISTAFNGMRNINYAACELTWKYLFPNEKMPEIVRLLGQWDNMINVPITDKDEWKKVTEFQYGARQCINNYEEAYDCLQQDIAIEGKIDDEYFISTLSNDRAEIHDKGAIIYQYLCTEAKQTYKKVFPIILNSRDTNYKLSNFLCVNQERFNPINFGIDYHKEGYDGFACFWYKDGKWSFSLYNDNGEVDCSVIAKRHGGGGHAGASGWVSNTSEMIKIINND